MSENSNNTDAVIAAWTEKPAVTHKAFVVVHGVKEGETVSYPAGYAIYGTGDKKDEVVELIGEEGRTAATGEKAPIFRGSVDLAPIWDSVPVAILRGYAAAGILLNAQQLFKSWVLAGTASVGSQEDMDRAFQTVCATPATMQGITPSVAKVSTGEKKAPGGKVKALEDKLAKAAETAAKVRELMGAIKAAKGAEKLALLEQLDELTAE